MAALAGCLVGIAMLDFTLHHAIPGILEGGRRASEKIAVSTLRTIYWGQNDFKEGRFVDADGNGIGEFGFLGELAAAVPPRAGGRPLPAPILASQFKTFAHRGRGGIVLSGPYCYVVYLPSTSGAARETAEGAVEGGPVEAAAAERHWIAYAWPLDRQRSADKVYFINQNEEVLESNNLGAGQGYSGPERAPAWDAALRGQGFDGALMPGTGGDGGEWSRWRNKTPKPLAPESR